MKKLSLVSLVVAILLMASAVYGIEAVPSVDTPLDHYIESDGVITMRSELAQLYDIGIMSDVGGGPYESITRAEMAKIVTQLYGMNDIDSLPQNVIFADVSSRNPYSASIKYVADMKIMNGYDSGLFLPDKDITYCEALKTIIVVLGYEPLALQMGGYPYGYLKVANTLGLITNPAVADYKASKNDLCDILHKAIDTPLMRQSGFGAKVEYVIMDGKNGVALETLKNKLVPDNK